MPIYSGYVTQSVDDYDTYNGSGLTAIYTERNRDVGDGSPYQWSDAIARVDTSGLSAATTINSATLWWYTSNYATLPKADPEASYIDIYNDTGASYVRIQSVSANRVVGWESHALTSGELGYINTTGLTRFKFTISDEGTWGEQRQWALRAWDYDSATTYTVKLVVDYSESSPPVVRRGRAIVIG